MRPAATGHSQHRGRARYAGRTAVNVNFEQQLMLTVGFFACAGRTATSSRRTNSPTSTAAGLSLNGKPWTWPDDTFGIASAPRPTAG
jgi:hypothetical protein